MEAVVEQRENGAGIPGSWKPGGLCPVQISAIRYAALIAPKTTKEKSLTCAILS